MSVQVVANLVDESILTNLPFLASPTDRFRTSVFVPSGSFGQIWNLVYGSGATHIYDITSSNGDLRHRGTIGNTSGFGRLSGNGLYAQNLDRILVPDGTFTGTTADKLIVYNPNTIGSQATGFTASINSAFELSLIDYTCSYRVGGTGAGITDLVFFLSNNPVIYTPSASVDYYSVFGYASSSNGQANDVYEFPTPLSASLAALSSSNLPVTGAGNLLPVGFYMSTFDASTPSNDLYVDLTGPLTSSWGVSLDKILTGSFGPGDTIVADSQGRVAARTFAGAYNSDLNRLYVYVSLNVPNRTIVELDTTTTPPTIVNVNTSSISLNANDLITYNPTNQDIIIREGSQFKIFDASVSPVNWSTPKAVITSPAAPFATTNILAISNSFYALGYPFTGPSTPLGIAKMESGSGGYITTGQSFATTYTSFNTSGYLGTSNPTHASGSNINKIFASDRSDIGPIGNPVTGDENLTTTFARADYVYAIDTSSLQTSSFFTPYTTQLNGTNASTAVTVSGSTEVGYRLNTRNLLLAYDAGSEDSFPPLPNATIYDLSGNLNNTTLPATVTYENISSSFFFTSSIANSAIPFTASELSTANFATFEMIVKLEGTLGGTVRTIYGFDPYSFYQSGGSWVFSTYNGSRFISVNSGVSGDWFHIVTEMYSGSLDPNNNNKLWLNGVQQTLTGNMDSNDLSSLNFNNGIGRIGGPIFDNNQIRMHGYIPVFKIYKRTLSQQEITENYNFYKSRYPIP